VTAAEKATYVTLSGANVFTGNTHFTPAVDGLDVFRVKDAAGTTVMRHSSTTKTIQFGTGASLKGYSDAFTAETWKILSDFGTAQFDSTVDALRFIGESIYLTLPAIDGGGSVITTCIKYDFMAPYNLTVTEWTLLGDQSGSIGIEFWKDTYANHAPTVADLVSGTTGTNNPRIVSATKGQSSTLTNWTTTWVQGEIIRVNAASVTTLTRCGIFLKVLKT